MSQGIMGKVLEEIRSELLGANHAPLPVLPDFQNCESSKGNGTTTGKGAKPNRIPPKESFPAPNISNHAASVIGGTPRNTVKTNATINESAMETSEVSMSSETNV